MLLSERPDCLFQNAGVPGGDLDDIVFPARRLVKIKTDFFPAASKFFGKASPAPAMALAWRN